MKQKYCSMIFYINQLKMSKISKKYPIYLKLVYSGSKVEIRLPSTYDVSHFELSYWDRQFNQFSHNKFDPRNTGLKEIQVRFEKYMRENNHVPKHSLKEIMAFVLDKSSLYQNWSVATYCDYYIENRVNNNAKLTTGTKVNYKKAVKHLKNFLVLKKLQTMPLQSFKHKDALDFELYMGTVAKNAPSSTTTNLIRLKKIFSEAINEELLTRSPFQKLKLTYRSSKKTPCLTIQQVKEIFENERISADPKLKFYRAMFLFGCFTGLSVSNIISLSFDTLFPIFDDRLKLESVRVKTNMLIVQILPAAAAVIVNRYGNPNTIGAKVFSSFSADDFREKLKLIAAITRININLTTKISRTTCNQLLVNVGGFDLIYKRTFMGWSNMSDIQDVYTTLDDNILMRNTINIDKYLGDNLGCDLLDKI